MFVPVDPAAHPTLVAMVAPMLDAVRAVEYFSLDGRPYHRVEADGFITLRVEHEDGAFGLVCNDFKLKGGSFSRTNSERLAAFVDRMAAERLPMAFLVDSMGIRLMEGRATVKPGFNLIPILLRYRDDRLLITCNLGRALGLGAVVFAAGHYRMAIAAKSFTNLAGPEVIRMFFGKAPDLEAMRSPERLGPDATLVHEAAPTRAEMLAKAATLVRGASGQPAPTGLGQARPDFPNLRTPGQTKDRLVAVLRAVADDATELFPCLSPSVRTYLASRDGRRFGLFVNPPGNLNNLVTAQTLERFALALELFRVLRLPLVSLLDTPGGDPRDNSEVIVKLWQTARRIIEYPFPKMGICIGRGFGGAILLGFPTFFGSQASYVLRGATVGLMHAQFIDSLLSTTKTLAREWTETRGLQTADCADLIAEGIIDAVIGPEEVPAALDRFLAG
jgi:acetyl-CoA carboxylase carboxyltransferase component